MTQSEFIDYCRSELNKSFMATKSGSRDDKQKHRTEGLLQAAKLLGILTIESLNSMIEEEHYSVFEESVEKRQQRKSSMAKLKESSPDEYFDIPAIERR